MNFTDTVVDARVKQDAFCCRGFTGVNVSRNSNIARKRQIFGHYLSPEGAMYCCEFRPENLSNTYKRPLPWPVARPKKPHTFSKKAKTTMNTGETQCNDRKINRGEGSAARLLHRRPSS
jgi:hypothetical protein